MMEITTQEMIEHIEDDNFFKVYGNPVKIITEKNRIYVLMSFELYEKMYGIVDFNAYESVREERKAANQWRQ